MQRLRFLVAALLALALVVPGGSVFSAAGPQPKPIISWGFNDAGGMPDLEVGGGDDDPHGSDCTGQGQQRLAA